jgi:hypothetical protein
VKGAGCTLRSELGERRQTVEQALPKRRRIPRLSAIEHTPRSFEHSLESMEQILVLGGSAPQ